MGQDELRDDVPEHKSDVYRRHEIGFDLNPTATATQIGAFLGSGLDGEGHGTDHWNKGETHPWQTSQPSADACARRPSTS